MLKPAAEATPLTKEEFCAWELTASKYAKEQWAHRLIATIVAAQKRIEELEEELDRRE